MRRVLLAAGIFSAAVGAAVIAQPPSRMQLDPAREIGGAFGDGSDEQAAVRDRVAEAKRRLKVFDPTGQLAASLQRQAEAKGTTLEALLAKNTDPAERRAANEKAALDAQKLAVSDPVLYQAEQQIAAMDMSGPQFNAAIERLAADTGKPHDEVALGVFNVYAASHPMDPDEFSQTADAKPDGAPPAIGSGKVCDYLSFSEGKRLLNRAVLEWAETEAAKIKARSPKLYEAERHLAALDWSDFRAADAELRRVAAAAGLSAAEVRDGAAVIVALSEMKEAPQGADAKPSPRVASKTSPAPSPAPSPAARPRVSKSEMWLRARRESLNHRQWAKPGHETGAVAERRRAGYVSLPGVGWVNPAVEQARFGALEAAALAATAQARAQQPVYRPAYSPAPFPYYLPPNPGPYYETVQHTGNQTWITGSGLYGPFNETIQHNGNQTYINGSGAFGPFNETISQHGNQTYVNGSGVPPVGFYQPYGYGGPYGGGYYGGFGGGY
ncbi:MAG TPA: hypothetical protein VMV10_01485 [Pirellulales bacterium]|nr:hypothetical protein [Pirellulales bacterium]